MTRSSCKAQAFSLVMPALSINLMRSLKTMTVARLSNSRRATRMLRLDQVHQALCKSTEFVIQLQGGTQSRFFLKFSQTQATKSGLQSSSLLAIQVLWSKVMNSSLEMWTSYLLFRSRLECSTSQTILSGSRQSTSSTIQHRLRSNLWAAQSFHLKELWLIFSQLVKQKNISLLEKAKYYPKTSSKLRTYSKVETPPRKL